MTKTMDDLEKLVKELFKEKTYVLSHLKIVRGSIVVTYLAPLSEADSLIMLAKSTTEYFNLDEVGLLSLKVGRTVVMSFSMPRNFSLESSLLKAVKGNDLNLISFLLNINTNPDATDDRRQTGQMLASFYNFEKAAALLLKANANPDLQRDDGITPLYIASYKGNNKIISLLLAEANADPNISQNNSATPLFIASENGHTDAITLLLKANADPNIRRDIGATPLYIASEKGHANAIALLLNAIMLISLLILKVLHLSTLQVRKDILKPLLNS